MGHIFNDFKLDYIGVSHVTLYPLKERENWREFSKEGIIALKNDIFKSKTLRNHF